MRNRRLLLMDLSFDPKFQIFGEFVQRTIDSINVGLSEGANCQVDYVRSRDRDVSATAFTSACDVLHVMAHAGTDVEPAFYDAEDRESLLLSAIPAHAHSLGRQGISASTVIADGCNTATGLWQRAIRDCLQTPTTYVGTTAQVGWREGTVFAAAFYGALLWKRGRGIASSDLGMSAAVQAIEAYQIITKGRCPYRAIRLEPSRRARTLFHSL